MTTFSDIFKKSFLQETGNLTTEGFFLSLIAALLCGIIIYFVYRYFFKGVIYNNNFNILLVMTSLVTCFIVIVISSNVVLSLGMVGALSIVRFRTAIKNPLDVGFLFWTVAVGITCGAGLYLISLIATIIISLVYILLTKVHNKKRAYLLIIKCHNNAYENVIKTIKPLKKVLKNRSISGDYSELTYEIHFNEENTSFVSSISAIEGVDNVAVIEFTGDYSE